ncbi:MAG TPA: hypothetical protein VG871_05090 [Vicinamibacterales bacterium]|nr:hypothetical protein [Vicinamibacterales bacterium]
MKFVAKVAAAATLCAAFSIAVSAQWPPYRALPTPLGPDGKPNLTAPTPRTPDGKPDFSGTWRGVYPTPPGRRGGAPPPPPVPGAPPPAEFRDVQAAFPGGLPLTPYAKDLLAKHVARNSKDNPEASCLPMGLMQFWTQGFPRKFVQTPKLLVVLYEASAGLRQIYLDGRPLPKLGDPQPYYYGYSSGHWEGDTLVVESNNFRDDGWLDIVGTPMTDQAKMIERFTRPDFGHMNIDITVDDPKAYTKPWTVRHQQTLMPDEDIIEFICEENNHFTPR